MLQVILSSVTEMLLFVFCQMLQDLNSNICFLFGYNFKVLLNLIYVVVYGHIPGFGN